MKTPLLLFRLSNLHKTMTTIVYEGATHTLYCDSMVTTQAAGATTRVDMTYKVEDLSRLKIVTRRRERLVALAFSGSVLHFQRITKFLLSNLHEWHEGHQSIADQGGSLEDFAGSNVMLVTDKKLHCFRFSGNRLDVEEIGLDENVTFGSGGAFAKAAMEVYGANGFEAMAAAAMCDPHTGCLIHGYQIRGHKLVPLDPVLYIDSPEERLRLRKLAGRSKENLKVSNLFEHPPENILVRINEHSSFIKRIRQEEKDAAPPTRSRKKAEAVDQTAASKTTGPKRRS